MIGEAPEFTYSKYFLAEPNWRLKPGVDEKTKEEFEIHMNRKVMQRVHKREHPEMNNPYYTWEGKIIDKG